MIEKFLIFIWNTVTFITFFIFLIGAGIGFLDFLEYFGIDYVLSQVLLIIAMLNLIYYIGESLKNKKNDADKH